ncbi:HIT family protein [Adhaeretor mobilis]|uniref:AP-4-A phosphorylase n=1 Tax=Adhaeretor mobilis TaxID=1930276 RepID=A0A517MR80_9BACT|nr:HIT domain-containing protein [Adhaeretor mobilis]QDS97390.1 AP-4-A phosphorylase [Adhaeretor mobilis]
MDEQRLWAPWRLGYVAGDDQPAEPTLPREWLAGASRECFVCRAAGEFAAPSEAHREHLVVEVGEHAVAILNRYPYANGHLLVCPRRHAGDLAELTADENRECLELLTRYTERYRTLIRAEGFNIGLNLGRTAGAGVPGHLHWHLVPRWPGDSNFMPVTAGIRVIPQSLEALWEALTDNDV